MYEVLPGARRALLLTPTHLNRRAFTRKNIIFNQPDHPLPTQFLWKERDYYRSVPGNRPIDPTDNSENKFLVIIRRNKDFFWNVYHSAQTILKRPNLNPVKMRSWIQFLTTPTADTPGTTLLLHFDDKRYLIGNVSEGTQRACVQRKISMIKIGEIFLTGKVDWASTGGILGMMLTVADATSTAREASFKGKSERASKRGTTVEKAEKAWLNIHGGENLTHLLATARRFVFRKGMPVYTNEYRPELRALRENWEPSWKDDNIKVWAMAVRSEGHLKSPGKRTHDEFVDDTLSTKDDDSKLREEEETNHTIRKSVVASMFDSDWRLNALVEMKLKDVRMPATIFHRDSEGKIQKYVASHSGDDIPDIDVLVRRPWPGALVASLPPTEPSTSAVSYIIKNHAQRGKFDPKEAIRLKVQPGRDFKTLASGESVTATDGSTVTSDQVLGPSREGTGVAIIDIPDSSYIGPLLAREEWSSKEVMNGVNVVFWILGPDVVADSRIEAFMDKHKSFKHIVSSKDCCSNNIAFESPAAQAIRLHLIDSERFPIPKFSNTVENPPKSELYTRAKAGGTYLLEPRFEVQDDKIIPLLDTQKVVAEADMEVLKLAKQALAEVESPEYMTKLNERQKDMPCKDAEVITLGTGSALPSKYRNVSATLLRIPEYGNYLFDCGENTLGQLKRVFGNELPGVLREMKVIWISHLHADHHLGTAAVIKAWHEETSKDEITRDNKLVVASDEAMLQWLKEYSEVENYGFHRLKLVSMTPENNNLLEKFTPEDTLAYGPTSIEACRVNHCHGALAVAINFPNGFKVAYSGDCRPSQDFVKIGEGATLLIHEATFDDELQGDAYAKKHSTTSEAMTIGKGMGARRILLTHFSQRYQNIPVMDGEVKDQVAIVAFDYMRVKICDFAKVAAFRPALLKLYEDKE